MNQQITLNLTPDQVNLVLVALSKLPLESSLETFMQVRQIAMEAMKEAEAAKEE